MIEGHQFAALVRFVASISVDVRDTAVLVVLAAAFMWGSNESDEGRL